jgi:hypothetical protein
LFYWEKHRIVNRYSTQVLFVSYKLNRKLHVKETRHCVGIKVELTVTLTRAKSLFEIYSTEQLKDPVRW